MSKKDTDWIGDVFGQDGSFGYDSSSSLYVDDWNPWKDPNGWQKGDGSLVGNTPVLRDAGNIALTGLGALAGTLLLPGIGTALGAAIPASAGAAAGGLAGLSGALAAGEAGKADSAKLQDIVDAQKPQTANDENKLIVNNGKANSLVDYYTPASGSSSYRPQETHNGGAQASTRPSLVTTPQESRANGGSGIDYTPGMTAADRKARSGFKEDETAAWLELLGAGLQLGGDIYTGAQNQRKGDEVKADIDKKLKDAEEDAANTKKEIAEDRDRAVGDYSGLQAGSGLQGASIDAGRNNVRRDYDRAESNVNTTMERARRDSKTSKMRIDTDLADMWGGTILSGVSTGLNAYNNMRANNWFGVADSKNSKRGRNYQASLGR